MGEETPVASVSEPCPACGRRTGQWLTWGEAHRLFGFARTSCLTCLLSEVPRPQPPPADVPESATFL